MLSKLTRWGSELPSFPDINSLNLCPLITKWCYIVVYFRRVAPFTSCAVTCFGVDPIHNMHTKVTGVVIFKHLQLPSSVVHTQPSSLNVMREVFPFTSCKLTWFESCSLCVMHWCSWSCPFFLITIYICQPCAQLSHSLLQVLMTCKGRFHLYVICVDIVWELPLFTSCTLKFLELSLFTLAVCSHNGSLATCSQVPLTCGELSLFMSCKLTWCGSCPLHVVHTGVPGIIPFLLTL